MEEREEKVMAEAKKIIVQLFNKGKLEKQKGKTMAEIAASLKAEGASDEDIAMVEEMLS